MINRFAHLPLLWSVVLVGAVSFAQTPTAQRGAPAPRQAQRGAGAPQNRVAAGPARGAPRGVLNQPARAPFPQLSPAQQKYVDQILAYWEHRSSGIERYRCKFNRWVYDPTFLKDPNAYKTVSTGVIKFASPDKGLFRVDTIAHYTPPQRAGGAPQYLQRPGETGEHWVCDGRSVFEFNAIKKQVLETILPEAMRGKAIAEGPLPFIFGAKVDRMKQRYWIRHDPLDKIQGEYWLEAYPKTSEDRANHQMIRIIIDEADYLPKAMEIRGPNYERGRTETRTVFQFAERETNWSDGLSGLNPWLRKFHEPAIPKGWQKVRQSAATAAPRRPAPQPKSAQRSAPASGRKR